MTIAIGFNFGSYVMLAADTRVTWHAFGMDLSYRDDSEKIRRTNIGIITGAGAVTLLDGVKKRLTTDSVLGTDDLLRVIREQREQEVVPLGVDPSKIFGSTGWIFSYTTQKADSFLLRLGMVHPHIANGEDIALYKEGDLTFIAPAEATEQQAATISDLLKKNIREPWPVSQLGDAQGLNAHIMHHWVIVAALIKGLQPQFRSISDKVQIGVHLLSGHRGVSPITSIDEPSFSLSLTLTPSAA